MLATVCALLESNCSYHSRKNENCYMIGLWSPIIYQDKQQYDCLTSDEQIPPLNVHQCSLRFAICYNFRFATLSCVYEIYIHPYDPFMHMCAFYTWAFKKLQSYWLLILTCKDLDHKCAFWLYFQISTILHSWARVFFTSQALTARRYAALVLLGALGSGPGRFSLYKPQDTSKLHFISFKKLLKTSSDVHFN